MIPAVAATIVLSPEPQKSIIAPSIVITGIADGERGHSSSICRARLFRLRPSRPRIIPPLTPGSWGICADGRMRSPSTVMSAGPCNEEAALPVCRIVAGARPIP